MQRTERHHLKENELAQIVAGASDAIGERRGPILGGIAAVVVIAIAVGAYMSWTGRAESQAHAKLAAALAIEEARIGPPAAFGSQAPTGLSFVTQREKDQAALTKYKEVADEFPNSEAGIYARYRQASTYMALGVPNNAVEAYQDVINKGGTSHLAQMAKLGLAEAKAQTGAYDDAINTFRDLAQRKDGPLPIDGLLLRLGRIQLEAGKTSEAEQTFNRLVQEFPDSAFTADARKHLDGLKKSS